MSKVDGERQRKVPLNLGSGQNKEAAHSDLKGKSNRTAPTESKSLSTSSRRQRRKQKEKSSSSRASEPERQRSPNSENSSTSTSTSSRKASFPITEPKRTSSDTGVKRSKKKSSNPQNLFTIGDEDPAIAMMRSSGAFHNFHSSNFSMESQLLDLERAFQESGLSVPLDENDSKNAFPQTPYSVRTPFEVDAPRETPSRGPSRLQNHLSSAQSVTSEGVNNPLLSQEQDAWAGIDALLETTSVDESYAFSTSDILPSVTVKALRRGMNSNRIDEDSVWDEVSEGGESRLSMLSRDLPGSSHSQKYIWKGKRSATSLAQSLTSNQILDSWHEGEAKESLGEWSGDGKSGSGGGEGGLFGMFQWSEKDNIDDQRKRKGKLNNQAQKLRFISDTKQSDRRSEPASLPSLASLRAEDLSLRSRGSNFDKGSLVTEHTELIEVAYEGKFQQEPISSPSANLSSSINSGSTLAGDGLVLDKDVDEYITRLQGQLAKIKEDSSMIHPKKVDFHLPEDKNSPSPISVLDCGESALDELPTLNSLSGTLSPCQTPSLGWKGRKEQKKEARPAITYLLNSLNKSIGSIKILTTRTKETQAGDEEKYFPEDLKEDKSKKYKDNRCLLSAGNDT